LIVCLSTGTSHIGLINDAGSFIFSNFPCN
jgi:hypothetical protein